MLQEVEQLPIQGERNSQVDRLPYIITGNIIESGI